MDACTTHQFARGVVQYAVGALQSPDSGCGSDANFALPIALPSSNQCRSNPPDAFPNPWKAVCARSHILAASWLLNDQFIDPFR